MASLLEIRMSSKLFSQSSIVSDGERRKCHVEIIEAIEELISFAGADYREILDINSKDSQLLKNLKKTIRLPESGGELEKANNNLQLFVTNKLRDVGVAKSVCIGLFASHRYKSVVLFAGYSGVNIHVT